MAEVVIPAEIGDRPAICGFEDDVAGAMALRGPMYLPQSDIDFGRIRSASAIALHMHQPMIPAGGDDMRTAEIISNLQHMMANPSSGDNHNAAVFRWCYKRMGEFLPELVAQGKRPRVMLDYSGCLLWGMWKMGLYDVFDSLRAITCDDRYRGCVEWLGTAWGHCVAPSTPVQDYRLHVRAWQHHFAALFGLEALSRVRGFSPCEMALPNHPDVCYEFVKTLKECGYRWVLVQEHTVERVEDGGPLRRRHLPHRLVARNSSGQSVWITAIIKTQGSDTKLVAQMQPYYEAMGLSRVDLAGGSGTGVPPVSSFVRSDRTQCGETHGQDAHATQSVPQIVTQIADGENGGVMMNEFPSKYMSVVTESSDSPTPLVNVSEYLEYLESIGVKEDDFPAIQPIMQKRIWDRFDSEGHAGQAPMPRGPEAMAALIGQLQKEDGRFHVEGGSWTNNISWVRGYEHVLGPMDQASAAFADKVLARNVPPSDARYRNALYHLLLAQTSCYRYWGSGIWTDYGKELVRRTMDILTHDF
jgi:hypothetical protein